MFQKAYAVNSLSHYHLVRKFLPYMIKWNHGHVVVIASAVSFAAIVSSVRCSSTKASALVFNEGVAQELKHRYNAPKIRTT